MNDPLHVDFRNFIHTAYKNLAGQMVLKGVVIDLDMASWGLEEFSPENQIRNRWACGNSANRICEILVGNQLCDYVTNPEAIDLAEQERVDEALRDMQRVSGYVLVQLNILGGGAGHSYVWLSLARKPTDPLDGLIYQTNVGVHVDNAFCLNDWVADAKSLEVVNLPVHLRELGEDLCGLSEEWGEGPKASAAYQKNYMLTGRQLKTVEVQELTEKSRDKATRGRVKFQWRRVDVTQARAKLASLRFKSLQTIWSKVPGLTPKQLHGRQ